MGNILLFIIIYFSYLHFNKSMNILKYIFYLYIIVILGCVDITPLPSIDSEKTMFVLCEMEEGKMIIADIYYIGDVNGKKIRQVKGDDFESFSLAEGDKDWGYNFQYNIRDSIFYIDADKFEIKSGLTYRFIGVGQSTKGIEPKIQIPFPIFLDTFIINRKDISENQGSFKTTLNGSIFIPADVKRNSFFYIIPKVKQDTVWNVDQFYGKTLAFNKLSHKSGFLVDYSLMDNNEIRLQLSISEQDTASQITFDIFNVTESFYRYNLYASNVFSSGNSLNINPPIAGFNIQTNKAYGILSAKSGTSNTYIIR